MRLALCALLLAACGNPDSDLTSACSPTLPCPTGYTCGNDMRCHKGQSTPDAGPPDTPDAEPDAPIRPPDASPPDAPEADASGPDAPPPDAAPPDAGPATLTL